ncbi:MAG: recombinase RecA [Deltaproteobacteria bacterium]|nr:recombinase RecA [Deltaproteobacteria bacterium]
MVDQTVNRISTGVSDLDEVLGGGLIPGRAYLVRGGPGAGKTTLGLHFLSAGAKNGDRCLFIALDESEAQIRQDATGQAIDLAGVDFLDMSPSAETFFQMQSYDIFTPAEVERAPTTQRIIQELETLRPRRVFIDALTQFRYLASDPFQFRKQVLSFLRFLRDREVTVVFSSESTSQMPDYDLQFLSDGVINLELGQKGRSVEVKKIRGSDFQGGPHALRLGVGGMQVFRRLLPKAHRRDFIAETISAGVPEMDELLHGGIERGTITVISGPSGAGKTTLGTLFMKEAAGRGERSVLYLFEENFETLLQRCEAVNIPIHAMIQRGTLKAVKVEPLEYTPDEFAKLVRTEVEERNATIVMLDSLSGYKLSLSGEDLVGHVHSLGKYLSNMGVTMLIIAEVESIMGEFKATDVGVSYLADNIIFLRYLEVRGEMHKAIGVLKKRLSDFEKTMRKFEITRYGVKVGRPLRDLRNILGGGAQVSVAEEK